MSSAISDCAGVTRLRGKVAIVTGASSGIGAAICRSLVQAGMVVAGVARSHQRVEALSAELKGQPGSLKAFKCDISRDDEVESMYKQVVDSLGPVFVCVNNAGMSNNSSVLEGNPQEWRQMFDVNVVAACLLTKLVINGMKEKGVDDGHIVMINSTSGHRLAPGFNSHFYAGTKFALRILSESIRRELRAANSHIRISSVSPGLVETEFAKNMTGDEEKAKTLYSSLKCLQSEDLAATVLHILTAPPHVEINDVIMRPTEQAS